MNKWTGASTLAAQEALKRPDGNFTDEEMQRILRWCEEKQLRNHCVVCNSNAVTINQQIVEVKLAGTRLYPCWATYCSNCGHYQFFNAILTNVLDEQETGGEGSGDPGG